MTAMKLISLAFVLVIAEGADATMTPHYSTYTNMVYNSNQTVTFTATLQGNSTSDGGGCPNLPHFYHSPAVFVNGTGGGGTIVAPCAYINISQSAVVSGSCLTDGAGCDVGWSASVYCSFIAATIFATGVPSINIKITTTSWGPPPIVGSNSCTYNILACSTGTPTCKGALLGIVFSEGCPDYVKAEYLVVGGTCDLGVAASATGPGICD
jgi:hypothetical protein